MYLGIQLFLKEWDKKSRLDYDSRCLGEDIRHHYYNAFPTLSCDWLQEKILLSLLLASLHRLLYYPLECPLEFHSESRS